jgi:hypothetical protein
MAMPVDKRAAEGAFLRRSLRMALCLATMLGIGGADPLLANPLNAELEGAYTSEDMQRARADGIALGRAEAIAEYDIERESERRRQDTLDAVSERLAELLAKSAQAAEEAARDALVIAGCRSPQAAAAPLP